MLACLVQGFPFGAQPFHLGQLLRTEGRAFGEGVIDALHVCRAVKGEGVSGKEQADHQQFGFHISYLKEGAHQG